MPISIEPAAPTTDTLVTFTFIGGSGCPNPLRTIDGSEFVFDVKHSRVPLDGGICLSAPIPYELEWIVGPLEAGDYEVTHINLPFQETETQSFVVVEGSAPGGPAPIPTTGAVGALLLAVALALVARRVLRRGRATGR